MKESFSEEIVNNEPKKALGNSKTINKFEKNMQDDSQEGLPFVATYDSLTITMTRTTRTVRNHQVRAKVSILEKNH